MDAELERRGFKEIESFILRKCKKARSSPEELFGKVIRTAIDEVVDGPRTGRWSLEQLSSPEKAYVGTKVEIIVKTELELERSVEQDAQIAGHHVNIKWSKSLVWMIGPENLDSFCLGLGIDGTGRLFSVGLFRPTASRLNPGKNRDGKRTLTRASYTSDVRWMVREARLPRNFIEDLPVPIRDRIFAETSAQSRVRALVTLVPGVPIPRVAFSTVALAKFDPMRRTRQDKYRANPLGGMVVLSTKYGRAELLQRGITDLPKDHFVAVSEKKKKGRTQ